MIRHIGIDDLIFWNVLAGRAEVLNCRNQALPINNFMGMTYLFAEDYEKSYLQFRHTIAMDPTSPLAHLYFSWLLTTMGKYEEGIKEGEIRARC
jgi:lipoprotein NlpI